MPAGAQYVAFDFWNQKLLGVFRDRMELDVEGHDTRVVLLHPSLGRPQLVGTSRHITGAWSIREVAWESARNVLSGASETVPGEQYTLFIYAPDGVSPTSIHAATARGESIPARHERSGNLLSVSFEGVNNPVLCQLGFAPTPK